MTQLSIDQLVTRVLDLADRSASAIRDSDSFDRSFDDHLAAARPAETRENSIEQSRGDDASRKADEGIDDSRPLKETHTSHEDTLSEHDRAETIGDGTEADTTKEIHKDLPVQGAPAAQVIVDGNEEESSEDVSIDSLVTIAIDDAVEVAERGPKSVQTRRAEIVKENNGETPLETATESTEECTKTLPRPAADRAQVPQTTHGTKRSADAPVEQNTTAQAQQNAAAPAQQIAAKVPVRESSAIVAEQPTRATKEFVPQAADSEAVESATPSDSLPAQKALQIAEALPTQKAKQHIAARSKSENTSEARMATNGQMPAGKSSTSNPQKLPTHQDSADEHAVDRPRQSALKIEGEPKSDQVLPREKPTPKRSLPAAAAQVRQAPTSPDSLSLGSLEPKVDSTALTSDLTRGEVRSEAPSPPQQLSTTPVNSTPSRIEPPHHTRPKSPAKTDRPITEAQRGRFLQRVAGALETARRGDGEVRIRLHPPELGALRMHIKVEDGALIARLETETQSARQLLLENLPSLRERLASQEIRIERFEVDVKDQSTSNREQQAASDEKRARYERSPQDRPSEHERRDEADADKEILTRVNIGDARLNVVI